MHTFLQAIAVFVMQKMNLRKFYQGLWRLSDTKVIYGYKLMFQDMIDNKGGRTGKSESQREEK